MMLQVDRLRQAQWRKTIPFFYFFLQEFCTKDFTLPNIFLSGEGW